eukprot:2881420-Rhodomonas_salina.2
MADISGALKLLDQMLAHTPPVQVASYAVSGTDLAYATVPPVRAAMSAKHPYNQHAATRVGTTPIVLRVRYAMSGTDIGYAPSNEFAMRCPVLTSGMPLCDVRY